MENIERNLVYNIYIIFYIIFYIISNIILAFSYDAKTNKININIYSEIY